MWNLEKHLQDGEKVLFEGTPAWEGFFGIY